MVRAVRNEEDVRVEFTVKEDGRFVPAEKAETTYNMLSPAGLQSRIGYVVGLFETFSCFL